MIQAWPEEVCSLLDGEDPLEADDVRESATPQGATRSTSDGSRLVYGSVDEWMRKYWRHTYRRRVSGRGGGTGRWRARWWESDEAVQRLEAIWRAWEVARVERPPAMSAWWLNHADAHMRELLAVDGPFAGSTDENNLGDALPYEPPPEGMFAPDQHLS